VKAIQERLGHASIVMTMDRYGHLLQTVDTTLLAAIDAGLSPLGQSVPDETVDPSPGEDVPPPAAPTPLYRRGSARGPGSASPR